MYLRDLWPSDADVDALLRSCVDGSLYAEASRDLTRGSERWRALEAAPSETFAWDESSTYIRRPPYFDGMTADRPEPAAIEGARALVRLGDFVTTDHISPAGPIAADSPAARYLRERGVGDADFNTYGSRRGNHEVMERGTFANVKLRNALAGGRIGCWTLDQLSGELASVWDAAVGYGERGVPLVVVAGQMYGSGSSRDWAAKGPMLQGVRAVLASSFERIHRSNLVGMGILPLQFAEGSDADSLGLDGTEVYSIPAVDLTSCELPATVAVRAVSADGAVREFPAVVRVDTPTEAVYIATWGHPALHGEEDGGARVARRDARGGGKGSGACTARIAESGLSEGDNFCTRCGKRLPQRVSRRAAQAQLAAVPAPRRPAGMAPSRGGGARPGPFLGLPAGGGAVRRGVRPRRRLRRDGPVRPPRRDAVFRGDVDGAGGRRAGRARGR